MPAVSAGGRAPRASRALRSSRRDRARRRRGTCCFFRRMCSCRRTTSSRSSVSVSCAVAADLDDFLLLVDAEGARDDQERLQVRPADAAGEKRAQVLDDLQDRKRTVGQRDARHATVLHLAAVDDADDAARRDRLDRLFQERLHDAQERVVLDDRIGVDRAEQRVPREIDARRSTRPPCRPCPCRPPSGSGAPASRTPRATSSGRDRSPVGAVRSPQLVGLDQPGRASCRSSRR